MKKVLNYIPDDKYTEDVFIRGIAGIHGDVRLTHRPMPVTERTVLTSKADTVAPGTYELLVAKELANRVTAWSELDDKGEPLPITPANIVRLKPALFSRIFAIIIGTKAGDLEAADLPDNSDADAELAKLRQECGL